MKNPSTSNSFGVVVNDNIKTSKFLEKISIVPTNSNILDFLASSIPVNDWLTIKKYSVDGKIQILSSKEFQVSKSQSALHITFFDFLQNKSDESSYQLLINTDYIFQRTKILSFKNTTINGVNHFSYSFHILFADFDGSGFVNQKDYLKLNQELKTCSIFNNFTLIEERDDILVLARNIRKFTNNDLSLRATFTKEFLNLRPRIKFQLAFINQIWDTVDNYRAALTVASKPERSLFTNFMQAYYPELSSNCNFNYDLNRDGTVDSYDFDFYPSESKKIIYPIENQKITANFTLPQKALIRLKLDELIKLPASYDIKLAVIKTVKSGTIEINKLDAIYRNSIAGNDQAVVHINDSFDNTMQIELNFTVLKKDPQIKIESFTHQELNLEKINKNNLGLLVNKLDPESLQIAQYYKQKYAISESNVFYIDLIKKTGDLHKDRGIAFSVFKERITELRKTLPSHIRAFAIAWRSPNVILTKIPTENIDYLKFCFSLASAVSFDISEAQHCDEARVIAVYKSLDLYNKNNYDLKNLSENRVYPAMHVAGSNFEKTKLLIDRGVLSSTYAYNETSGFLQANDSVRSKPRIYDWMQFIDENKFTSTNFFFKDACKMADNSEDWLKKSFATCVPWSVAKDDFAWLKNQSNVLFYFHGTTKLYRYDTNQYLPGAIVDYLTSFAGILGGFSDQMPAENLIDYGVTATFGSVQEPMATPERFPKSDIVISNYLNGLGTLESYFRSVKDPSYATYIGDPLANPFSTRIYYDEQIKANWVVISNLSTDKIYNLFGFKNGTRTLIYGPFKHTKLQFHRIPINENYERIVLE